MKMESDILTECFVDSLIAQTILYPIKDYNHQKGCNNVLKRIREKFADKVALGIIDDDKTVANFNTFLLLKRYNEHLSIYKHSNKPHYIIKISKAVEDFILKDAERCNISLADYHLPTDITELKNISKHIKSVKESMSKFKRLFSALKQNKTSDFHKLAQWIELFKENPYEITIESL